MMLLVKMFLNAGFCFIAFNAFDFNLCDQMLSWSFGLQITTLLNARYPTKMIP